MVSIARIWVPVTVAAAGIVLVVIGGAHTGRPITVIGVLFWLIALIVWMINWLFRMSIASNRDREEEERAREYFDRHGYWPGEEEN
jgi:drug/metabolite transporter (DMT)-like permease